MEHPRVEHYCHVFKRLKRANHSAPHKPVLLISVCQAIAGQIITAPFFTAMPELVALFRYNWSLYVDTAHNPVFTLPFTKMDSEPFWSILLNPGYQAVNIRKIDIKSFNTLRQMISGVVLEEELFTLLQDPAISEFICAFLVAYYFPGKSYMGYQEGAGFADLEQDVLEETTSAYTSRMRYLLEAGQEEEVAVRGAAFRRTIPRIYQYTCAVTGWSLTTPGHVQMIDACHIVPFSQSLDDTITNGIALCPTIHRAFDRGLISLDAQYRLLISADLTENHTTVSLRQFAGRTILLPRDPAYHPGQENLHWHRSHWGFLV